MLKLTFVSNKSVCVAVAKMTNVRSAFNGKCMMRDTYVQCQMCVAGKLWLMLGFLSDRQCGRPIFHCSQHIVLAVGTRSVFVVIIFTSSTSELNSIEAISS